MSFTTRFFLRTLAALLIVPVLASCGGGGTVQPSTVSTLRALDSDLPTRKAVNYSPFRTATGEAGLSAEVIPPENILQDLQLINAAGFRLIRVFDSSDKIAKQTIEAIAANGFDMKVQLGLFISGTDTAFNQAEIARAIALANTYPTIVRAVSVGNEKMASFQVDPVAPAVMAGYIAQVRNAITQPVTTDDNYAVWANISSSVSAVVDYASVHVYPVLDTFYDPNLWDWRQASVPANQRAVAMMDAAITEARRQVAVARAGLDLKGLNSLPIVVGETGWSAVDTTGGPTLSNRAGLPNQKMYFDRLQTWQAEGVSGNGPKAVFYFQAFDEPWKLGDDGWGLFNQNRQARYVLQSLGTCSVTWTCEAGTYTDADAVYFIPPTETTPVSTTRYKIYSDVTTGSETIENTLTWDAFGGNTAVGFFDNSTSATGDSPFSFRITPAPASYGWGMLRQSSSSTVNLSEFAGGSLHISIRTTYPGKIELGLGTDTFDRAGAEAYIQLTPGSGGYNNDDAWHDLVIPISAFTAVNPNIDLRYVNLRFIIANRYSATGNTTSSTAPIYIDGVYWTK